MEPSKQAPTPAPGPSPSEASHSVQPASQDTFYQSGNLGVQVPISAYLIVPMGGQPAQVGASSRPSSRVSLRPPQQVLNVQAGLPGIFSSQPSPSSVGKKMAASPKVQTLNSGPSISSVQKEALLFESVRAKFRETLAAALGMDSEHLNGHKSASNASPIGSSGNQKHADDMIVEASKSTSKLNSEGDLSSDIGAGANVSLNEPKSKRPKISGEVIRETKGVVQNLQILAFKIEEELFNLFGGVGKKYKEKGRSLLFNLKDESNPDLRKQVLSGDITPKFLCSMTAEELASKELSAWRLAKAEELAKKVVRPNREVDVRRLVRKTHKGEFHIEVEESDGVSVEVELGGYALSHALKSIEGQAKSDNTTSLNGRDKDSDNTLQDEIGEKSNSNTQSNSEECLANEKAAPVQECMVDDLKDKENLPAILAMDKFAEAHNSELHYEDHSTNTATDAFTHKQGITLKLEKYHIAEDKIALSESAFTCNALSPKENCRSKIETPKDVSFPKLCQAKSKREMLIKAPSEMAAAKKPDSRSCGVSVPGCIIQSNSTHHAPLIHDRLWEGIIQFTLSSLTNVVAVFKSGEKPSTNDWHRVVEIKGSVRLNDFLEFLKQLPNSKSRAVTVTELRWKEGSRESGRQHLVQTIDSYIADEKVGLAKPAQGVDLYLCPSYGKAAQILAEHLPKEHLGSLTVTGEAAVIGVVVWRRHRVSTSIPIRLDGSKRLPMSLSRNQQAVIASSVPMPSKHTKPPASHFLHSNEHDCLNDDDGRPDVVPPGYGQGGVKHDDDLTGYGFVSVSNTSVNAATSHTSSSRRQQHVPAVSAPLDDQVRQLVRKYSNRYISAQPWDGNDDDQVRQLVRRYGDRYVSAQRWDGMDDDLSGSELDWDPIQSGHQHARHPLPPLPLTEYDQQTHRYDHRYHQQQEHYEQQHAMASRQLTSPVPPFSHYVPPHQHVMTMQERWNYESVMHPGETRPGLLGWPSSTQRHIDGMHAEEVTPMQNFFRHRQSCFAVEPEYLTQWHLGPRRWWD